MKTQFEKTKKDILSKLDKSSKGFIDEKIKNLCETINKKNDLISLSSCSGRICLLEVFEENNKKISNWLTVTHDEAIYDTFKKELNKYKGTNRIDFKFEAAIMHIQTNSIENAQRLINLGKESGFNRCGIISSQRKIVVELICKMSHSTPVFDQKNLITEDYLNYLVKHSNEKLVKSWESLSKYEIVIKNNFE